MWVLPNVTQIGTAKNFPWNKYLRFDVWVTIVKSDMTFLKHNLMHTLFKRRF